MKLKQIDNIWDVNKKKILNEIETFIRPKRCKQNNIIYGGFGCEEKMR